MANSECGLESRLFLCRKGSVLVHDVDFPSKAPKGLKLKERLECKRYDEDYQYILGLLIATRPSIHECEVKCVVLRI